MSQSPFMSAGREQLHPAAVVLQTVSRGRRLLGRVSGADRGPTLVVIGGVHGNEPSGLLALERVLSVLKPEHLRGDFVALAGNLAAARRGVRYIDRDLNRMWTPERVAELEDHPETQTSSEDHEQVELLAELERAFGRARGRTFVLDLHSTSGEGSPFVVLADTLRNRRFAAAVPVPVVLGLEEQLKGTLLSYLSDLGHLTFAFESGQHDNPRSADNAEAAIWLCLAQAGLVAPARAPIPAGLLNRLEAASDGLPGVVEAHYRHAITPADRFRMEPGFTNFQPVDEGQVLAYDADGSVASPSDGFILMPLYQPQGDDGFFLVRGVHPFWLRLSASLRRFGADRFAHWLPGVHRVKGEPGTYRVDRRVARWAALELFHLLGFRKVAEDGAELTMARRPHDIEADHWGPFKALRV